MALWSRSFLSAMMTLLWVGVSDARLRGVVGPGALAVWAQTWRNLPKGQNRSGGTPGFVVIDREGVVRFNGFHLAAPKRVALISEFRFAAGPMSLDQ